MKKLKEKLALILIYMPIIIRSAGFLLIIEATLSMFIGETSLSIFISIPIIVIFQYILQIDWIINILLVIVAVIRQVFVFDSLNLGILIVGAVLYTIPMLPIIIMLISSSREKRRERRSAKKKQVEKRVTEWEHMMLKEKGSVELVYCAECGASYIKGQDPDICTECGSKMK